MDNTLYHKELSRGLVHDKLFAQCINKIVTKCLLQIKPLTKTLDYRIIGGKNVLNITDSEILAACEKIDNKHEYFNDSIRTLDWDVAIIPKSACGCFPNEPPPKENDFDDLIKIFCDNLGQEFALRYDELNWILGFHGLKVIRILYNLIDRLGHEACGFSIQISYNGSLHNVGILDVYNGSELENLKTILPFPKVYFPNEYGLKFGGLLNSLRELYHSIKFQKNKYNQLIIYSRIQLLLNCASLGLLSYSYYNKLRMYKNKNGEKELMAYINDIDLIIDDISKLDIVKKLRDNKESNFTLSFKNDALKQKIILTNGTTVLNDIKQLKENVKNSYLKRIKDSENEFQYVEKRIKKSLKDCCKEIQNELVPVAIDMSKE